MELTYRKCALCHLRITPYEIQASSGDEHFHSACLLKHLQQVKGNGHRKEAEPPVNRFQVDEEV